MGNSFSDEELEKVVLDYIDVINNKLEKVDYSIECLSDIEKNVLFVYEMELEVKNGGIHQYFYNSTGDCWVEMLNALQIMKAEAIISLFERALAVFPNSMPSQKRDERWKQLDQIGKEGELKLEELSQEYFSMYGNLPEQDIYTKLGIYIVNTGVCE